MKFKALMLSLSLTLGYCIPSIAGELDGEHVVAQEPLPDGMTDRIMIRKNPKNADEIMAFRIPKSVAVAADELEGLKDEAAKKARTEELVKQIETPANAIVNPKQFIKELDEKTVAAIEKKRELNGELSTPAWGWRRWARAAYWGGAYFSPYVRWGGYAAYAYSYWPYYGGWNYGWGGYAYGFYGNCWFI